MAKKPMVNLTDDQIDTITSYADGADRVMRELGIDRSVLNESLLNHNVERCGNPRCAWYTDSFSLLDVGEDEPDGFCDNCRRYDKPSNELR
ncbi:MULTISPECIES: hypothetical protein [Giesbergeria]|uniref:Uncharacterized protein n=1 Tax=Giesbergeria sinuosa TaxID=80883 RepID=A0ABV9QCJ8_9BURK